MIWLDHAATSSPKDPRVVEAVVAAMVEVGAAPGRGGSARGLEAARIVALARERAARLFAVPDAARIAFTLNATDALNLVLKGSLSAGDHVVTTAVEHNSVLRPLRGLEQRAGLELEVATANRDGSVEAEAVLERVRADTAAVVLSHASNVTGALLPVAEIGAALRQRAPRARLIVDAAQTAGYRPLDDVAEVADAIAAAGHKGAGGPLGTGLLWLRKGFAVGPLREGGTGTDSASPRHPSAGPEAWEAGSPNLPGIAGLSEALRIRLEEDGLVRVAEAREAASRAFLDGVARLDGVEVLGPTEPQRREPVFPLLLAGLSVDEAGLLLETECGLVQRGGLHCSPGAHRVLGTFPDGTLRISFGALPDAEEVAFALRSLRMLTSTN